MIKAVLVALLGTMAMATTTKAQTLFVDDFASGDARAWDSALGSPTFPTGSVCPPGAAYCAAMTLSGGVAQQSPYFRKDINFSGPVFYVSMMRMFPAGYTWHGEATEEARSNWNHKLIIIDTADAVGRLHLNLSVNVPPTQVDFISPVFRPEFESVAAPLINQWTDVRWPADGKWHQVEFEVTRKPGAGNGHLRLWLDGGLVFDKAGSTCGTTCSPIVAVKYGAYVNQGADIKKTMYLGKFVAFGGTREQALGAQVPPPPPAPTPDQILAIAADAYVKAQAQMAVLGDQIAALQAMKLK